MNDKGLDEAIAEMLARLSALEAEVRELKAARNKASAEPTIEQLHPWDRTLPGSRP